MEAADPGNPPRQPGRLDRLAHTVLEQETLEEDEAYAAAGIRPGTAPAASARGKAAGNGGVRRLMRLARQQAGPGSG